VLIIEKEVAKMNDPVERKIRSEIHGRNALRHIERICEFGDRFVGTEGDQKTLNYVRDHFEGLGLKIELTNTRAPTYEERSVELVLTDTGTKLEAISPNFTEACPDGIEGEIVYIGEGRENGGKIVVLNEAATGWDWFWLGPFSKRAAIHGAVGLIIIHPFPWPNRMSMEAGNLDIRHRFVDQQVPAVCIDSEIYDVDSAILSGVIEGSQWPEERIALIGHRDSPIPPAANDNGSGIGCQLELARVLSKFRPKRSVEFICSTAEEGAAPGAWHFVQANKERLPKMKALINMDMLGTGGRLNLAEKGQWHDTEPIEFTTWLLEMLENVADELGYYVGRMIAATTSEETRFLEAGVPAAWFYKWDDYYYHSEHDTPEKIDANSLKAVADIVAITIWRLANEEPSG